MYIVIQIPSLDFAWICLSNENLASNINLCLVKRITNWSFSCNFVMQDRSFTFILKTPPASVLLLKAAGRLPLSSLYGGTTGFADVAFIVAPNMHCHGIPDRMFEYIFNFIELEIGVKVIRVLRKMYHLHTTWTHKIRYSPCTADLASE